LTFFCSFGGVVTVALLSATTEFLKCTAPPGVANTTVLVGLYSSRTLHPIDPSLLFSDSNPELQQIFVLNRYDMVFQYLDPSDPQLSRTAPLDTMNIVCNSCLATQEFAGPA